MTNKINGYRELSAFEVEAINSVKQLAETISNVIQVMEADKTFDQRWLAIAKTDLQKGFMALTRSIAKPTTF
jgi:hypothetical protein